MMLASASHGWNEARQQRARRWLVLAVFAVAVSGLFAILIALARVPALGTLFPGAEFYRVALVLHVNLSQGVWFMAFAGVIWSLAASDESARIDRAAWWLAVAGTGGLVLSVSTGNLTPLMSNYLPVLDSPVFLSSLAIFGTGVCIKSISVLLALTRAGCRHALIYGAPLKVSALAACAVFLLLAITWLQMGEHEGLAFFETLFWGAGHLWQFALLPLLMYCWLELAPRAAARLSGNLLKTLLAFSALPVVLSLLVPAFHSPEAAGHAYTWLMRWLSWEAPLLLGVGLWLGGERAPLAPGFSLSLLLFVVGLLLGSMIEGQTTLITAHYHGTIGAITLAFMALAFRLLPVLGLESPSSVAAKVQLAFYGYGVLLMMLGLAGAGLMGAPRKTPGDLAVSFSVETVSRICLGIGGLCATIGIIMFAWLLIRRLFPATRMEAYSL